MFLHFQCGVARNSLSLTSILNFANKTRVHSSCTLPSTHSHAHNWMNKFQIKWDPPRVNNSEKVGQKYVPERIVLLLDKIFPLDLAPREFHWAEQGGG